MYIQFANIKCSSLSIDVIINKLRLIQTNPNLNKIYELDRFLMVCLDFQHNCFVCIVLNWNGSSCSI